MKKCNKVKNTCGTKNFAMCISYEGTINSISEYTNEDCLSIEETTQDIYNQLEQLDLSELGESCLEYVEEDGKILVKNVLKKYEEEICYLKNKVTELENRPFCNQPIADCIEDFSCLSLPCDNSIITVKDWMLAVQAKICETL